MLVSGLTCGTETEELSCIWWFNPISRFAVSALSRNDVASITPLWPTHLPSTRNNIPQPGIPQTTTLEPREPPGTLVTPKPVLERSRVRKAVTGEKRSELFLNVFLSLNNRTACQILDSDLALQVPITQEQLEKGSHQAQWIPLVLTSGHRDNIRPQENMQSTCRFISNLDVHVNLGVGPGFFHWWFSLKEEKQNVFHESRRWLSMSHLPPSSAWKKASEKGMRWEPVMQWLHS